jgi:hypothetical protein
MGSGEDCFAVTGAFTAIGSPLESAGSDRGSSMLLKKSSTLTAEAEDLAELSAPVETVVIDDAKA